ncbi:MAG: NHL repeat-containing protein [Desulfitobacteriaceae bacterium]
MAEPGRKKYSIGDTIRTYDIQAVSNVIWTNTQSESILSTHDGKDGYFYAIYSNPGGNPIIRKISPMGITVWSKSNVANASAIHVESDGTYYIATYYWDGTINYYNQVTWYGYNEYTYSMASESVGRILKFSSSGVLLWESADISGCKAVASDSSGNVYVGHKPMWPQVKSISKLDSNGNVVWDKDLGSGLHVISVSWGEFTSVTTQIRHITINNTDDGIYVSTSYFSGTSQNIDRLNASGDVVWTSWSVTGGWLTWSSRVVIDSNNNAYFSSNYATRGLSPSNVQIFASGSSLEPYDIALSGNMLVHLGRAYDDDTESIYYPLTIFDLAGHKLWQLSSQYRRHLLGATAGNFVVDYPQIGNLGTLQKIGASYLIVA